jgi:hypothetical protein
MSSNINTKHSFSLSSLPNATLTLLGHPATAADHHEARRRRKDDFDPSNFSNLLPLRQQRPKM